MSTVVGARAAVIAAALLALPTPAASQYRGHYVPGMGGMDAGRQTAPGLTATAAYLRYTADSYRDAGGDTIPAAGSYNFDRTETGIDYGTRRTLAGARYAASFRACYVSGSRTRGRARLDGADAIGDGGMYLEPLSLGWEPGRANRSAVRVAYGVHAPWKDPVSINRWGQLVTLGATHELGRFAETQISLTSVTELHGRRPNLTLGDNTTLELAAGQTFPLDDVVRVRIGYSAFGQWQFTSDTGRYYSPARARRRDRIFGFGTEGGVALPALKSAFVVRAEAEFGARNRSEGALIIISAARSF